MQVYELANTTEGDTEMAYRRKATGRRTTGFRSVNSSRRSGVRRVSRGANRRGTRDIRIVIQQPSAAPVQPVDEQGRLLAPVRMRKAQF